MATFTSVPPPDLSTFEDLLSHGQATNPRTFEPIRYSRGERSEVRIYRESTGQIELYPNVLKRVDSPSPRAFYIYKKLKRAIYGKVTLAIILEPYQPSQADDAMTDDDRGEMIWKFTKKQVAIKQMSWDKIRELSERRHAEDPIKELSAMQFIGDNMFGPRAHVSEALETLSDNRYLYCVMPFYKNGELFDHVKVGRFTEPRARFWFKQIISALHLLQSKGVSHRDMSLENLMVDDDYAVVIDLGMCLLCPYNKEGGRLLMIPQGQCGKFNYMSPEVYHNRENFDGFAIDIWACGIILFCMCCGVPPFDFPIDSDKRYRAVRDGRLLAMVRSWRIPMSDEVGDLIQRMLMADPRQRISLAEVLQHPWTVNPDIDQPPPPAPPEWAN